MEDICRFWFCILVKSLHFDSKYFTSTETSPYCSPNNIDVYFESSGLANSGWTSWIMAPIQSSLLILSIPYPFLFRSQILKFYRTKYQENRGAAEKFGKVRPDMSLLCNIFTMSSASIAKASYSYFARCKDPSYICQYGKANPIT